MLYVTLFIVSVNTGLPERRLLVSFKIIVHPPLHLSLSLSYKTPALCSLTYDVIITNKEKESHGEDATPPASVDESLEEEKTIFIPSFIYIHISISSGAFSK